MTRGSGARPGLALAALALLSACGGGSEPVVVGGAPGDDAADGRHRPRYDLPIETPVPGDATAAAREVAAAQRQIVLGHPQEALDHLKAALAADPAHLPALLLRGRVGLQRNFAYEPLQALAAFRTARLVAPDDVAARLGEAGARIALEDDEGAAPLLAALAADEAAGRVALSDEQRALLHRSTAQVELRAGALDAALLAAERSLQIREERGTIELRAQILERMGRFADARDDLAIALRLRGDDASLHFVAARVARRLGDTASAERHQRAHQVLLPFEENTSVAFRQDFAQRIELRRAFVAAWPEYRRGRHLLVRELLAGGQAAEARRETEALLAEEAADPEAWYLLALALARAGDPAAAREAAGRMMTTGKPVAESVHAELLREIERGGAPAASDGGR